jgi:betaine-aldehyde dehydrogenase
MDEAMDEITNPSTGERLAMVASASAVDVDRAVKAANDAFPSWRDTPIQERALIVHEAAARVRELGEELATLDALDCGNPINIMRDEVGAGTGYMDYFAGVATEMKGYTIPVSSDTLNMVIREPLGVVARIMSFNHPLFYMTAKTAAPLVAGNTVVFKPSDQTPLSALRIAEIWHGLFPVGVFNLVTGGREAGRALAEHQRIAKVGLIGSVNAGRAVMRSAGETIKRLTLELGGKNAFIACADADPAKVATGVVRGMNFHSVAGQSCGSTSRIYLHEAIHDVALEHIIKGVSAIKVGLPTHPDTEMGCLSSKAQFEKVISYIELAREEGAHIACGGDRPKSEKLARGYFIEPTVLAGVTDEMRVSREEIFGPVVSILKWRDEDELLKAVNGLSVGLTAAVWSPNIDEALRLASGIQAGYVWINDSATHHIGIPFGGYKQSGFGREESLEELLECTQMKTIQVKYRN